jgi:hypothetical protein
MAQNVIQVLNQLFNQDCKHRTRTNGNNVICVPISTHINTALINNVALPNDTIQKFYDYLVKTYYYYSGSCLTADTKSWIPFLKKLFVNYPPPTKTLEILLQTKECDICYVSIPNNIMNDLAYINTFMNYRFKHSNLIGYNDQILVDTLLEKIKLTDLVLSILIGSRSSYLAERLGQIIDKTVNLKLLPKHLDEAANYLPSSKPIISALVSRGIPLNSKHLEAVCLTGDILSIDYIIHTGKLMVKAEHFKAIILSKKYMLESNRHMYYHHNNNNNNVHFKLSDTVYIYSGDAFTSDRFEVLIKNGYMPNTEDVLFSITYKKELPGLHRFTNIKLDKTVLEACWDNDFYPQTYKFDCISKEQIQLQELCKTRRVADIRGMLKANSSLTIDRKCMENSCTFAKNTVYEFLKEKGGVPNVKCIENMAKALKNNKLILQVIKDFDKVNTEEIQKLQKRVSELEKQVADEPTGPLTKPVAKTVAKTVAKPVAKPVAKRQVVKGKKNVVIIDDVEEEEEEGLEEEEEEKTAGSEKIKKTAGSEKIKKIPVKCEAPKNKITEVKTEEPIYITLPINQEKVLSIQKDQRNRKVVTKKMIKILGYEKEEKVNYSEVRNSLLVKIKDEKWIKDNKNVITLPGPIKKVLNLTDKVSIMPFSDLDRLVCLLY